MRSIVIRRIPDEVFEWMRNQAKASVLNPESWLRLKLIEMARKDNQKGVSEEELNSPLVWENNQDGESVRVVKK